MTHEEKIKKLEELKEPITTLYCKEGRSKSYISRLFNIDRKYVTHVINNVWKLEVGHVRTLTPSRQKFYNKNKQLIRTRMEYRTPLAELLKELKMSSSKSLYTLIDGSLDEPMIELKDKYKSWVTEDRKECRDRRIQSIMNNSSREYNIEEIEGEIWKPILGNDKYFISNKGRVKRFAERYNSYYLLQPQLSGKEKKYLQIEIPNKRYKVHRLVGFTFLNDSWSKERNTINHIDGNTLNNCVENLEWVSQSENNKKAYELGKRKSVGYSKFGKFKKIILKKDGVEYKFSSISAFAKFVGLSETQASRHLYGEVTNKKYNTYFVY